MREGGREGGMEGGRGTDKWLVRQSEAVRTALLLSLFHFFLKQHFGLRPSSE